MMIAAFIGCVGLVLPVHADESSSKSRLSVIRSAPDFSLTDQDGTIFRMADQREKILLVSFIFTTCSGTCPATTHRMGLVQRELAARGLFKEGRVRLLSITVDPDRDTPEVLRQYLKTYDADPASWSFLTGPVRDVQRVLAAWGMWARPGPNGQLDHPSRIYLVDGKGRVREIYNLGFLKPSWVAEDVQLLADEARG